MARPDEQPPSGSWISILLAACVALVLTTGLVFLTLGLAGLVVLLGAGIFALAAFHYLVWGWWLSKILRKEEERAGRGRQEADEDL